MDSENYQLELPYRPSSVSVYWKRITIPKGLPALLETFVREAIRENPDDIYQFLADLSQSLLAKRAEEQEAESDNPGATTNATASSENGGAAVVNGNATKQKSVDEESPLLVDSPPASIQSTTIEIEDHKLEKEEAEKPLEAVVAVSPKREAEIIAFEGLPEEIEAAATKLQANIRGYQTRKHLKEETQQNEKSSEPEAETSTKTIDKKLDEQEREDANVENNETTTDALDGDASSQLVGKSEEEIQAAAAKIQAGFRGFQTRKQLKGDTEEEVETRVKFAETTAAFSPPPPTSEELEEQEVVSTAESVIAGVEEALSEEIEAATKIQAGFRGFQTRKALQRTSSRPEDDESENVPVEEEILSPTVVSTAAVSPSPKEEASSTPTPAEEKDDDEEIAAEIKTPLETIREESFDCSSSSHQAPLVPAPTVTTEENQTEVEGHIETFFPATVPEEESAEQSSSSPDEDMSKAEDLPAAAVISMPNLSSAPNSASRAERLYNVHMISTDDVSAALGDLLDDTEDEEEESISEDEMDEALEIFGPVGHIPTEQDQAGVTKGPTGNNDIDNKNDELNSSSDNAGGEPNANDNNKKDDDEINDSKILDSVQNGDHQTETTAITNPITEEQPATTTSTADDDAGILNPPHEKSEDDEVSPIAPPLQDNNDHVEVVIEEKTQNIPPEEDEQVEKQVNDDDDQKQEEGKQALSVQEEAINLSSSEEIVENTGNACETATTDAVDVDQTAICTDGKEEIQEDGDDKNKKSDHDVKGVGDGDDDDHDDAIIIGQSTEKEGEMNAEKNTPNIEEVDGDHTAPQEEMGHHNQNLEKAIDDDCGGDAEAKSGAESIQLPQSNESALTEISVDREDTDIATPTDFSLNNNINNPTQEEADKDSLNLEELKKFSTNFEEEAEVIMEPTTINSAEGAGASAEQKPAEASPPPATTETSLMESAPVESGQVMQADVISPEPAATEQANDESAPAKSPDAQDVQIEPKSETPAPVAVEEPPTPILRPEGTASSATLEEAAKPPEESTDSAQALEAATPAVEATPVPGKSPETPAPVAESPKTSETPQAQSPEAPISEQVKSPDISAPPTATSPEAPPTEPEKTPETPASADKPAQTPETPIPAAEPAKSPETPLPTQSPESTTSEPAAESAKSPETPAPAQSPESTTSESAKTTETPAPESEPAPSPGTPAPTSEPTQTPEASVPAAEPAQTQETPVPAAEPAQTPETPAPASEPAQTPETPALTPETPASEPAKTPETPAPESDSPKSSETPVPDPAKSSETPVPEPAKTPETPAPAAEPSHSPETPAPTAELAQTPDTPAPASEPETSPAPEAAALSQSSPPASSEPGSEQPKTDSSAETQAPAPTSEAAPAPEQTVTPAPSTESQTSAPPSTDTIPAPESTTTTNQPEQSESSTVTNEPPSGPADKTTAGVTATSAESKDAIKNESREEEGIAETPSTPVVLRRKRERATVPKEQTETKSERPTVKPRLRQSPSPTPSRRALVSEGEKGTGLSEEVGLTSSPSQSPSVVRRQKVGGPGRRSRVATSKYRSGLVIDSRMSMEEMEKEIDKEMMDIAATKIQARFRGFHTRKQIGSLDEVSKSKKPEEGDAATEPSPSEESESADTVVVASTAVATQASSVAEAPVQGAVGGVGVESHVDTAADIASRVAKPPLAALRSLSFPGSHDDPLFSDEADDHAVLIPTSISAQDLLVFDEGDEDRILNLEPDPDIELELDPDYINRAATRIQANFRGYQVRKSFKRPSSGKENNGNKTSAKSQKLTEAAREEIKNHERSRALDQRLHENNNNEDPPAQPDKAAAKIQASFRGYKERHKFHQQKRAAITIQANIRGYLTRKRVANLRRRSFQRKRSSTKSFQKELEDLRKIHDAATKIQAVFRGYQVRSKMPRSSSMIDEQDQMIDE